MRVLLATDGPKKPCRDRLAAYLSPAESSVVRVFAVASLAQVLPAELESAREYRLRLSERTSLIASAARDTLVRAGWTPRSGWQRVTRAKRSSDHARRRLGGE